MVGDLEPLGRFALHGPRAAGLHSYRREERPDCLLPILSMDRSAIFICLKRHTGQRILLCQRVASIAAGLVFKRLVELDYPGRCSSFLSLVHVHLSDQLFSAHSIY